MTGNVFDGNIVVSGFTGAQTTQEFGANGASYMAANGNGNNPVNPEVQNNVYFNYAGGQVVTTGNAWRWCTRPVQGEVTPNPKLLCDDRLAADGIWASGRQHPVQHNHAEGSLGLLASKATGSQPRSDQQLVTTHSRFY
jgi:hypothetical protein